MLISYCRLKKIAFACLALPSVIFALGFLRWYIGITMAVLVALAYILALRRGKGDEQSEEKEFFISKLWLFVIGGAIVLWCYLAGLGNLYYQSGDWWARNAIFRDLISHRWPVTYEIKDAALVYYIGFWLPPAIVGKLALGLFGDMEIAFFVGNIFLWAWSVLCIFVTVLVSACFVKARSGRRLALLLAIFIFFSGLDIVGTVFGGIGSEIVIGDHIEWWTPYQISSVTTCLFWVFNQAIFSWLTTACFINEKKIENYLFILLAGAPCSPFSCVGLGIYMLGVIAVRFIHLWKKKNAMRFFSELFSLQNILSGAVLPVYFFYYASNLGVGATKDNLVTLDEPVSLGALLFFGTMICFFSVSAFLMRKQGRDWRGLALLAVICALLVLVAILNRNVRKDYVFTVLLECGVYLLLLWKDNKKEPIFYLTLGLILLCPLIRIGTAADFCMRASIPAVFTLMALSVRFLLERGGSLFEKREKSREQKLYGILCVALVFVLSLGAITPYKEIERGIVTVHEEGRVVLVNDYVYTLDRIFSGEQKNLDRNFIAADYKEKLFFKYLAKKN